MDDILEVMGYPSSPKLIPYFLPLFEDAQIRGSDSRLDISTKNSERKWNICILKSKFGCRQPETNPISKIERVAIL